jgi:hypothetical protein
LVKRKISYSSTIELVQTLCARLVRPRPPIPRPGPPARDAALANPACALSGTIVPVVDGVGCIEEVADSVGVDKKLAGRIDGPISV